MFSRPSLGIIFLYFIFNVEKKSVKYIIATTLLRFVKAKKKCFERFFLSGIDH